MIAVCPKDVSLTGITTTPLVTDLVDLISFVYFFIKQLQNEEPKHARHIYNTQVSLYKLGERQTARASTVIESLKQQDSELHAKKCLM